jgi:dTDP-4-amino-4,6-dideoxygalactose transaminase
VNRTPFNRPPIGDLEKRYLMEALESGHLAGDGEFTWRCHAKLREITGARHALLTHSCTAALEMAAILCDLKPGDEVVLPSYTFVSTANAVALRGATPVFVDIEPETLNLDPAEVEKAITPKSRAIFAVHYAGVAADMDRLQAIAKANDLLLVEDAAQGMLARYKGRHLGTIGDIGAISFHETKNLVSGEGGALLTNDDALHKRAEIIREKGTDRSRFLRGAVDKYSWQDIGSSYLPSDLIAALLLAQLERAEEITKARLAVWERYHAAFAEDEQTGLLRRPIIPEHCEHNGHLYYLLLGEDDGALAQSVRKSLVAADVLAVTHYVPLHSAPAGKRFGRAVGELPITCSISPRLLRLPLFLGLAPDEQDRIIGIVKQALRG